jgi:hypothetical protein
MQRTLGLLSRQSTPEALDSLMRGWAVLRQKMPKGFEKFFPKGKSASEGGSHPVPKGNNCVIFFAYKIIDQLFRLFVV